jgi:hypothetical protein
VSELISLWHASTLAEQFQTGAVLIACVFLLMLAAVFCGPVLVAGARDLFPDETFEDDEQRLVESKRRRRDEEFKRHGIATVDTDNRRALLEAIAHMPHPTNRIH